MAYVQPQSLARYDKYHNDEPVLMKAACKAGDAISFVTDSTYGVVGILADATDLTKLAMAFASRDVSAADLAASYTASAQVGTPAYNRGVVTPLRRCVFRKHSGSAGTAQTIGSRVYLKPSSSAGDTTTLTQPTTNLYAVQPLGIVANDGLGWICELGLPLKYVTAASSVVTF